MIYKFRNTIVKSWELPVFVLIIIKYQFDLFYRLNYPPVKSQLQKVMESPIVRLTDRKYMTQLALNIIKDHEEQQKIRIEKRMLASPLIITELLKISHQVLSNVIQRQGINKLTLYA